MNIISDETIVRRTRNVTIEGLPAAPVLGYSYKGKQYIPAYANAVWLDPMVPDRVTIGGPVLKADGTAGERIAEFDVHLSAKPDDRWRNPAPQWVWDLFAEAAEGEA